MVTRSLAVSMIGCRGVSRRAVLRVGRVVHGHTAGTGVPVPHGDPLPAAGSVRLVDAVLRADVGVQFQTVRWLDSRSHPIETEAPDASERMQQDRSRARCHASGARTTYPRTAGTDGRYRGDGAVGKRAWCSDCARMFANAAARRGSFQHAGPVTVVQSPRLNSLVTPEQRKRRPGHVD